MLHPRPDSLIRLPAAEKPALLVVVDTEEEFDWSKAFDRDSIAVTHIEAQASANRIFARFKLKPTYVVDYAVASQERGYKPLREWLADGACQVGTHLHPWVNPPHEEQVNERNSYAGNLAAALERDKLARLTDTIAVNIGARPTIYRAGRYGVGPHTTQALEELGYEIDTSVVPRSDFRSSQGPDFSACGLHPYWFGNTRRILEIPLTVGWTGLLAGVGMPLQRTIQSSRAQQLKIPGILARARLFDRVRLTPEGISFDELCRLTRALVGRGIRVFNFSYHSPSLVAGHTPYVRDDGELRRFLDTIEKYFEFFFGEMQGRTATPHEIRTKCVAASQSVTASAAPVSAGASARP